MNASNLFTSAALRLSCSSDESAAAAVIRGLVYIPGTRDFCSLSMASSICLRLQNNSRTKPINTPWIAAIMHDDGVVRERATVWTRPAHAASVAETADAPLEELLRRLRVVAALLALVEVLQDGTR